LVTPLFQYIPDRESEFLSLFPHRFDYIFAEHPQPGDSPHWQTESRYPLGDRQIEQGTYLFGVRFSRQTNYCLLDIDAESIYHPKTDPLAISRIQSALEPLGLVAFVPCTSSYSGGLHLYFPFQQAQNSWDIATAVSTALENSGFKIFPGQLEIFPNPKPYVVNGHPTLFNAHRLPMQLGSYLLNDEFQTIWSSQDHFVQCWKFVQQRNDLDAIYLKQLIKQSKRKNYRVSGKADKFLNDLNTEIETGWTGYGQTNYLLGRITMRCYIFHHLLFGGEPLEGQALADEIVAIARSLPGYTEWCRHQHEIEKKAIEWSRCIENSHYFHYGYAKGKFKAASSDDTNGNVGSETLETFVSWNQKQSDDARERIRQAIATLLENDALPSATTARFKALTACGIGGTSLYRHRDLWHPQYLVPDVVPDVVLDVVPDVVINPEFSSGFQVDTQSLPSDAQSSFQPVEIALVENPVENPVEFSLEFFRQSLTSLIEQKEDCALGASSFYCSTSLLSQTGSNLIAEIDQSDRPTIFEMLGSNFVSDYFGDHLGDHSGDHLRDPVSDRNLVSLEDFRTLIQTTADGVKTSLECSAMEIERVKQERYQLVHQERMQSFLESGDPILMQEARSQVELK
jgi:hypothetical protein